MRAVIMPRHGHVRLANVPAPSLRPGHFLVKTEAVALSPLDVAHVNHLGKLGGILGSEFSGMVEAIGEGYSGDIKVDDAVFGVVDCANMFNAKDGAFAKYVLVKFGLCCKVPYHMPLDIAAGLGLGITYCALALYYHLKLPLPTQPTTTPFPILIYGGSTAKGSLAIQYAKLSGLRVITTCSPKNFGLVRSRGADAFFDYHDPDCGSKIRAYTKNRLAHVIDTIADPTKGTAQICANALSSSPFLVGNSIPTNRLQYVGSWCVKPFPRRDVEMDHFWWYSALGEQTEKYREVIPADPRVYEFVTRFQEISHKLLVERKLEMHPPERRPGGLHGVQDGLVDLKMRRVSGRKIIYRIDGRCDL